jgi:hypothetical protein
VPLDLVVTVLNINVGFNKTLMRRNKTLSDYAAFIQKVRDEERAYGNLAQGIKAAVTYCLKYDILKSFLEKHSTEVFDMLEGELDMDLALKIRGEEGWEEGLAEGEAKGEAKGLVKGLVKGQFEVLDLMEQGYSAQQIRDMLARQRTTTAQG